MKERGEKEGKNGCRCAMHAPRPIGRSQFCREWLSYDITIEYGRRFNRNRCSRRGFLPPEAKRSISRGIRGEKMEWILL